MSKKKRLVIACVAITTAFLIFFGPGFIRAGFRYYTLQRVLDAPEAQHRASVVLSRKALKGTEKSVNPINLGYAGFDVGCRSALTVEAGGVSGSSLLLICDGCTIWFMPPFSPKKSMNLSQPETDLIEKSNGAYKAASAYLRQMVADPLESDIKTEQAIPPSFPDLYGMSRDDFLLCTIQLSLKANDLIGQNEVYAFTTSRIEGLVQIGKSPQDRAYALAKIYSLDGTRSVGCHITLNDRCKRDIEEILDPILSSFEFTASDVSDPIEMGRLISKAGIKRRDSPTNLNLSHTRPVHQTLTSVTLKGNN